MNKVLELDIDSREIIRGIKPLDQILKNSQEFKAIKDECLNKSLDECLTLSSKSELSREKILGQIRKEIYSYRSNYFHLKLENDDFKDPLVCRCMGKTLSDIEALYHEFKGDRKKILITSHISGVCGTCLEDFDCIYREEESKKAYIEGLPATIWIEKVEKLIEDFYFVCPSEYSQMKFEVISMNTFHLKIRCDRGEVKIKRSEIVETLSNYFQSELKLDLKLSVVI